jgi:hypothetical protein
MQRLYTTKPSQMRRRCINGIMCATRQIRAASRHLPSLDFYLYAGWYRTRRDVACNVSTPPNHRICMDGASIVLCARPTKSVRHRAICHHWIFIYTSVGIAPVETLHATSLHHQTIAYAWTVHQSYYVRDPPNPCGIAPFAIIGFLFIRRLVSHP